MQKINDAEAIQTFVRRNHLGDKFGPQVVEAMELRVYADREMVCLMGEMLDGLYVLVSGKLKIHTLLPNGKTMLLRFSRPPSLIGDVEWTAQYPVKNNVEAVGECSVLVISRELIMEKEANNPAFLWFMIQNLSHKLYTLGNASAMNLLYPVENRFASYLLSLFSQENSSEQAEEIRTSTLTETAEMLGTSYRHLNRVINRLIQEGVLVRKKGRLLVLNEARLRELAGNHLYN
ncbi:Crp/Fnr family transcriptional regulator [Paenibacillus sp. SI8]|uniref:Crp/Fnr family transcriptional regulator n=1 Tax=unclassified Paenibacillus TaxID=185978 RepID=UPI0034662A3B